LESIGCGDSSIRHIVSSSALDASSQLPKPSTQRQYASTQAEPDAILSALHLARRLGAAERKDACNVRSGRKPKWAYLAYFPSQVSDGERACLLLSREESSFDGCIGESSEGRPTDKCGLPTLFSLCYSCWSGLLARTPPPGRSKVFHLQPQERRESAR
jgi:hypothetical protein